MTCACGRAASCDCGKCVGCCGAASSLSREGAPAEDRAREAPGPRTAEPIHWLGDATQDRDVYELRERYPGRLTTLGGPTTLYFTMPNGEPIIVPVGWWICDDAGEPYVASAPPSPGALDRAREEGRRAGIEEALKRALACLYYVLPQDMLHRMADDLRALAGDAAPASPTTEPTYVIECVEHARGEEALWWRPNRMGYTTDLNQAGRYSRTEAEEIVQGADPGDERMHRLSDVLAIARPTVDRDRLRILADNLTAVPTTVSPSGGATTKATEEE